MTEEEAKRKWCPFVRIVGAETHRDGVGFDLPSGGTGPFNRLVFGGDNRDRPPAAFGECLASACMAWRWRVDASGYGVVAHGAAPGVSKTDGRCGLAGPE